MSPRLAASKNPDKLASANQYMEKTGKHVLFAASKTLQIPNHIGLDLRELPPVLNSNLSPPTELF